MRHLLEANFVEACRQYQRCVVVGFVASSAFLATALGVERAPEPAEYAIPVLKIEVGNPAIAALFVLAIYVGASIMACVAASSINKIRKNVDPETLRALETHPGLATASLWLNVAAVVVLAGLFAITFSVTGKEMSIWNAIWSGCTVSLGFIFAVIAIGQSHEKVPKATQQNCTP